jgi:ribosomal protein S8
MSQDIISDTLNQIMNAKKARKKELSIKMKSKLLIKILDIMKRSGYINYSEEDKIIKIEIKESLNECRAIKPRFNVASESIEKYVRRFLPSRDFGFIIISTSKGLMIHDDAVKQNIGGSLIAYIY